MESIISRELLGEVLGIKNISSIKNITNTMYIYYKNSRDEDSCLNYNIHELAHMCKEWASSMGYDLYSHRSDSNASYAYLDLEIKGCNPTNNGFSFSGHFLEEFEADTEPEAIFKACQWILDNKANQ